MKDRRHTPIVSDERIIALIEALRAKTARQAVRIGLSPGKCHQISCATAAQIHARAC